MTALETAATYGTTTDREVMERIYGESGANFSLTRTHIGSCDFSVEGKYSYADEEDATLAGFSGLFRGA